MAVAFSDVSSICQEAFYILRQDATVLTQGNWSAGTPIEVAKCKLAIETAVHEVVDAFGWDHDVTPSNIALWPSKVRNACVYCLARELAIPIAGRVEDMKSYDALYRDKLLQAKLSVLGAKLRENDDPVLAQLLVNFRADDAGLANDYAVYTQRSAVAKQTAATEISAAHEWTVAFDFRDTAHPAYPAWVVLSCAKLASVCGYGADRVQLYMTEYERLLSTARAADLEQAKQRIVDEDVRQVLAMISTNFVAGDALMPRSIKAITDRIDSLKESARKEVLLAHDWNFACVTDACCSCPASDCDGAPYMFSTEYPFSALRLVAVYGAHGRRVEWKIENGMVRARERIAKIRYIRDVDDFSLWSEFARNAYIHRLAADVARTVMNNQQDAAQQEARYNLAIENAKLRDTRESSTPTDAWGDNYYVEQMQGRRRADDLFPRR